MDINIFFAVLIGIMCTVLYLMCTSYSERRILWKKLKSFLTINIKIPFMLNTKALAKALQFMLLPSAAILLIIFIWFFSWSGFVGFITAQTPGASFLRVFMLVAEAVFICVMYNYFDKRIPNEKALKSIHDATIGKDFEAKELSRRYADSSRLDFHYTDEDTISHMLGIGDGSSSTYNRLIVGKPKGVDGVIVIKTLKEIN